jgi:hypothetical protein
MKRPRLQISWKTLTLTSLRKLASLLGVKGRSRMTRQQLVTTLRKQVRSSPAARNALAQGAASLPTAPAPAAAGASKTRPAPPPPAPQPTPTPAIAPMFLDRGRPIPDTYGVDTLRLMPRDPEWIYAYWEITPRRLRQLRSRFSALHEKPWQLRLVDVTNGNVNNIPVFLDACSWYLHVRPRNTYRVELGFVDGGIFVAVLNSNVIKTPANAISTHSDERWLTLKRDLLRMLHLSHEADLFGPDRPVASAERFREITEEQLRMLERLAESARTLGASGDAITHHRPRSKSNA